jgi:hypothetical protein
MDGQTYWLWGGGFGRGRKDLVLGPGKNDGYHRAGRVVVLRGGPPRWGRINISGQQAVDQVSTWCQPHHIIMILVIFLVATPWDTIVQYGSAFDTFY